MFTFLSHKHLSAFAANSCFYMKYRLPHIFQLRGVLPLIVTCVRPKGYCASDTSSSFWFIYLSSSSSIGEFRATFKFPHIHVPRVACLAPYLPAMLETLKTGILWTALMEIFLVWAEGWNHQPPIAAHISHSSWLLPFCRTIAPHNNLEQQGHQEASNPAHSHPQ